jgi:hypothetical protein
MIGLIQRLLLFCGLQHSGMVRAVEFAYQRCLVEAVKGWAESFAACGVSGSNLLVTGP